MPCFGTREKRAWQCALGENPVRQAGFAPPAIAPIESWATRLHAGGEMSDTVGKEAGKDRTSALGRNIMNRRVPRGTLLAATLALLATTPIAQQMAHPQAPAPSAPAAAPAPAPAAAAPAPAPPAAAALPPGSPLIGRPDNNPAAAKLAPVPAPPFAAALA